MGTANAIFDFLYNYHLLNLGLSESDAGLIYSIATCAMAFAVIPLSIAAKRYSQNQILLVSTAIYACSFLGLPFAPNLLIASIILSLVLVGMLGVIATGNAVAAKIIPESKHPVFFSLYFIAYIGSGALIGLIISANLSSSTSNVAQIKHYLIFASIIAVLSFLARIYSLPKLPVETKKPAKLRITSKERRSLGIATVASFAIGGAMALVFRFANILFLQAFELPQSTITAILSIDKFVAILGSILAPLLLTRLPMRKSFAVFGMFGTIGLVIQAASPTLFIFIGAYFGRLLFNYAQMPLLDSITLASVRKNHYSTASLLRQSSFYFGGAVFAFVYGLLFANSSWQQALVLSAGLTLVGTICMLLVKSKDHQND